LGSFQVTNTIQGDLQPQGIAIFEWATLEEHEGLMADSEAKKLFPIRDDALNFIKTAYYTYASLELPLH